MLGNLSLKTKLFAVLLTFSLGVIVATFGLVSLSFETGFLKFVEARHAQEANLLGERLQRLYQEEGGWKGLLSDADRWRELQHEIKALAEEAREAEGAPAKPATDGRVGDLPAKVGKFALLDSEQQLLIGRDHDLPRLSLNPLTVDDKVIGYVGIRVAEPLSEKADIGFAQGLLQSFSLIAAVLATLCAALAWPMAHLFSEPLRRFADASRQLSAGDYGARISVVAKDEFGSLAEQFNRMAAELGGAEERRRGWLADVSHELRTPVALLRAEVEALQDGVRPLSLECVKSIHNTTMRLQRLVDDLYQLALADTASLSFQPEPVDLGELLTQRSHAFRASFERAGLTLESVDVIRPAVTRGDPALLTQLIDNLLGNALRYTTAPGCVRCSLQEEGASWVLAVEDSPPGVADEMLERIFERFVRGEGSRSRTHGGAGLGLAISRQIAQLHQGLIRAEPSSLGGLCVSVRLPRESIQ